MTDADGTTNYIYNNDGQLTGASGSALPSSDFYSYDSNGNRTNSGDTTSTNNELTSDGTYDYTYDADGNLFTQTDIATGTTINYTWDYHNRLSEVTYKNASGTTTETIQYTYNAYDQRISQTITNGSGDVTLQENYIYDGANLLMVLNGSGSAKSDARTGITEDDMQAYKDLNQELPDPFPEDTVRGPESHPGRQSPVSQQPHGHVGPVGHIPIR